MATSEFHGRPGFEDSASHTSHEERPLSELMKQLSRDGGLLVQQEIALAKQELQEKAEVLKKQVAAIAVGAVVLHLGAIALMAALTLLLSLTMPAWVAALVVGVLLAAGGIVLVLIGRERLGQADLTPRRTIDSVRSDFRMTKEAIR